MKKLIIISIISLFSFQCEKGWLNEILDPTLEGCNISTACNYNPDVNKFDNSCEYTSCIDCLGIAHGVAKIDNCGTCDAVASNDCEEDCEGVWGGSKIWDCDSVCNGTNFLDHCNECDADSENNCVADCAGVWGGSAVKDECDICGGGGSCNCGNGSTSCECCCPEGQERDCLGACGGSAVVDQCDVCGGDNACLPPDLFSHNQSTRFAYYFIFSAYDYSGEYLEANQDWIGVFNGEVCVGAKLWQGGPTEVPAYGNDGNDYSASYLAEGDMPTFKIYDASENAYHDAVVNEDFVFQHLAVNNILRMDVYVDCLGDIGGTAVIDICGVCNGDGDCEGIDCTDNSSAYCTDLSVLQGFIDSNTSLSTQNPLDIGYQVWTNGRLISLTLANSQLSVVPNTIENLTALLTLNLIGNQLTALPQSICNLPDECTINVGNNQLCNEFHYDCITDWGGQIQSNCEDGVECVDIDGNVYEAALIGEQLWMAENLKVTHYQNGDEIPTGYSGDGIPPPTGFLLDEKWADLTTGAYAVFPIDIIYANVSTCEGNCSEAYGNLYNWYAVDDSRDVCPEGWHVPSDAEWMILIDYLGGATPEDCESGCLNGTVADCSGDGDCCDDTWINDGYGDCEDQTYGCDLICYDNDGGDCDGRARAATIGGVKKVTDGSSAASVTETDGSCAASVAGGKMKEIGTSHWFSPNTGATNESGFTGLSAGWREASAGGYPTMGWDSYFWSSSEYNSYTAQLRELVYNGSSVYRMTTSKQYGCSVRCIKD